MVQVGHITTQQLDRALDYQKKVSKVSMKLGEILNEMGYITVEVINWALNRMKRKLGEVLVEMGFLKDYELNRALALQRGA